MKKIISLLSLIISLLIFATPAFAHVVVKPSTVGIAAYQTFTVGVPNEKDNPVVALKLLIPDGLKSVTPNVKPGWKIDVKKQGEGDNAKVTEIDWTTGSIPAGQRDEFSFSAQAPANETDLNWKAYQTYSNGEEVSWDQDPKQAKGPDDESSTPFSVTKVINDINPSTNPQSTIDNVNNSENEKLPLALSVIALVASVVSLGMQFRKK